MIAAPAAIRTEMLEGVRCRQRVLFLADHLGMDGGGVHGVTTYLLDLLPGLKATGMEIGACFLRNPHPAAESLRARGVEVKFLGSRRFDLLVIRQVNDMVRRESWNILHCTQFRASVIGRAVARLHRRLRAVVHVHDLKMPPPYVRLLNRLVADRTDLGLCVSLAACDIASRGYHLSPGRLRVLYTGIDTEHFRPLPAPAVERIRRELDIPATAPTLCLLGRFHAVKGHAAMIRMFKCIADRRPECVLMLVGSGPERPACENLAREMGLKNVRFLGYRRDAARLLAAADVAVVPSTSEGLCRAAIEANLCGLPVVAFDCGGVIEALADAVCGEVVPPGDQAAFIDAIERALRTPRSSARVDARVQAATRRFGLAAHVAALRECYEALD
jgi:glycosyltransferase involved in cell wall biosynthesis